MARIDVEIEDYLDEVRSEYLFRELKRRKDFSDLIKDYNDELKPKYIIPDFKTSEQLLDFIKVVLKLQKWHDKKRIIQEIESL